MHLQQYHLSCHCGAIKASFEGPTVLPVLDCNCSVCTKKGYLHYIVPQSHLKFDTTTDWKQKSTLYTFGTHTAKHYFCSQCGISCFYVPRSNPDGFDINVRCLDNFDQIEMKIEKFDGQNWEKNADSLSHLSKEE
jgi:hypothetical protein